MILLRRKQIWRIPTALVLFFCWTTFGAEASNIQHPPLILGTTEGEGSRTRSTNGALNPKDPGYYVELAMKAADACETTVEFRFMNWARVLKSIKVGKISAGFASSYKLERAEYGAYPMKDGRPNEALAQRSYRYNLYARVDDLDAIENWKPLISGETISVEKSASIIPTITELGADIYERTDYHNMLNMVLNKRLRFAVGIADNFDGYIEQDPRFRSKIVRLDPPVKKTVGYVMFGKQFYEDNRELVNCYWQKAADLAKTKWYEERKKYYADTYN